MNSSRKNHRYCFVGGGTVGSLSPLLALAERIHNTDQSATIQFVVSRNPAERSLIASEKFAVQSIPSGKFRRYLDWRNITDLLLIAWSFVNSMKFLRRVKPDVVVSAGSFVAVPFSWAAWFFRIPVVIHQQDVTKGFANRLMSPIASLITVTFAPSLSLYPQERTVHTGNPVRAEIFLADADRARTQLGLSASRPLLVVLGGSSGAAYLNGLIEQVKKKLLRLCDIVHLVGRNYGHVPSPQKGYYPIRFLSRGMGDLLAAATCVVARAGLSTLSELSVLGKPALLIPMPGSHQEANANYAARCEAALRLDQRTLTPEKFFSVVSQMLVDTALQNTLSKNIRSLTRPHATDAMIEAIQRIIKRP